jgi:hypothetical protein
MEAAMPYLVEGLAILLTFLIFYGWGRARSGRRRV